MDAVGGPGDLGFLDLLVAGLVAQDAAAALDFLDSLAGGLVAQGAVDAPDEPQLLLESWLRAPAVPIFRHPVLPHRLQAAPSPEP